MSAKHRAELPAADRSPQDLEHDIETTRDRLADTLDELLFRIKPKTIVSRQVEETRSHFVDSQGRVRTEKVAAVAGAAIGVVAFFVVARRLSNRKG
jgi:P2-related tail formation protein